MGHLHCAFAATLTAYACCVGFDRQDNMEQLNSRPADMLDGKRSG